MRSVVRSPRSLAVAAIVLSFAMVSRAAEVITEFQRDGFFEDRTATSVREIDAADISLPLLWEGAVAGGSLTVRGDAKSMTDDDQVTTVKMRIELTLSRGGRVGHYEIPFEEFVCTCTDDPDLSLTAAPFGAAESNIAGVVVSYQQKECGMHFSSENSNELLIDVSQAPRAVILPFSEIEHTGYGNAGLFPSTDSTECRWNGRDFECSLTRTTESAWARSVSVRRFTALGGQPLPIVSSHSPRVHSLDELVSMTRAADRAVLVDDIGLLWPVLRVAPGVDLYASVDHDEQLAATFYLIGDRGVTSLQPPDIMDVGPDHPSVSTAPSVRSGSAFTRVSDGPKFRASTLRSRGSARLYQVVLQIGEERSLYWIAIDPAEPEQFGGVRVASTAAEGEDVFRMVPASLLAFRFRTNGQVAVNVASRWFNAAVGGPMCCMPNEDDESMPAFYDGVLTWSPSGFTATLNPRESGGERVFVTIGPDATLGMKPLASIIEPDE